MDRLIKVFGERNTATRAVIQMLDAAEGVQGVAHQGVADEELEPYAAMISKIERTHGGPWKRIYREAIKDMRADVLGPVGAWKHAAPMYNPAYQAHDISVIFMVRNPYSWIVSMHQRPYHAMGRRVGPLEAFIDFPWLTVARDNVDRVLPSPVMLWPLKLRAYKAFEAAAYADGVPCATIKFEDFVQFPVNALKGALEIAGLSPSGLKALTRPTKPYGKLPEERRKFYAEEKWRDALSRNAVARVNDLVDWRLAEPYGYERLRPNDFPDIAPFRPENVMPRPASGTRILNEAPQESAGSAA